MKYDPIHDRFVLVFLNGFDPLTSYIIVAFHKQTIPAGLWNMYALPGNPKDNDRWTDYPMIALTEGELFLTETSSFPVNPGNRFSETLISDESGRRIQWRRSECHFWDDVFYGGAPIRNIHPVQGEGTPYGPISTCCLTGISLESNDSIFIVHVNEH